MSGRMRGSFCVHADAHLDGRLLAIGGRHDGDDRARDDPVRIGIEHGFDRVAGMQPADRGLVDVDLDLDRVHVDDGADAGAGETAAGRQRRDHLAGLRAALDHDAGERRADLVLAEHLAAALGLEPRRRQLGLRLAELGPQHAGSGLRLWSDRPRWRKFFSDSVWVRLRMRSASADRRRSRRRRPRTPRRATCASA